MTFKQASNNYSNTRLHFLFCEEREGRYGYGLYPTSGNGYWLVGSSFLNFYLRLIK